MRNSVGMKKKGGPLKPVRQKGSENENIRL
jgi:hypothetical protein